MMASPTAQFKTTDDFQEFTHQEGSPLGFVHPSNAQAGALSALLSSSRQNSAGCAAINRNSSMPRARLRGETRRSPLRISRLLLSSTSSCTMRDVAKGGGEGGAHRPNGRVCALFASAHTYGCPRPQAGRVSGSVRVLSSSHFQVVVSPSPQRTTLRLSVGRRIRDDRRRRSWYPMPSRRSSHDKLLTCQRGLLDAQRVFCLLCGENSWSLFE